jgi:phosphoserine phosphatase RsbU/P
LYEAIANKTVAFLFHMSHLFLWASLMLSKKLKIRISLLAGLLSWLAFMFFDIHLIFVAKYQMNVDMSEVLPEIFFSLFIASTFFYFHYLITKADSINFIDLLWRVFITGLITTLASLGIRLFFSVFSHNSLSQNPLAINFFYNILIGLIVVFMISTFVVWKRLILYQKTKTLVKAWAFFEYTLLAALFFDFFGNKILSANFNIVMIVIIAYSLYLTFNLKWIAYLNFKQKWKSILFILISGVYVYNFFKTLDSFSTSGQLSIDLMDRVFIVGLFVFIILYAVVSILVTLFNLPTSSVFEKKMQEAMDFQKLSHVPRGDSTVEETAELLLESSMSAVFADAAWIEIKSEEPVLIRRNVSADQIRDISDKLKSDFAKSVIRYQSVDEVSASKVISNTTHETFKSVIVLPIFVKDVQVGVMVLMQEAVDAFDRETVDIIVTFVNQASISIENATLIREAIENERYKEQLSIAKNVQRSLLPNNLSHNESFDIVAYSAAADEVGGDYYDIIESKRGVFNLIIADVSGKGTSAAFNMAQLKGVFHSLAYIKGTSLDFMIRANKALSKCLERSSFITASYFKINTAKREISYSRAGHCPAIFYQSSCGKVEFLESKGLGLGILRNSEFNQYVEERTITYLPNDLLLLYTDGVTEAKNLKGIQYGAEGLKRSLQKHINKPLAEIKEGLIQDLLNYLEGETLDDDYTLTIIKFEK